MTLEFHAVVCPICRGTGQGETFAGCEYCGGTGRIVIRERERRGMKLWKAWLWFSVILFGLAAALVWLTRH